KKLPFFHLAGALNFYAFLLHSGHGTKCFVPLINISSLLHDSHLATLIFAGSFSLFSHLTTLDVFLFLPTYMCYPNIFMVMPLLNLLMRSFNLYPITDPNISPMINNMLALPFHLTCVECAFFMF